MALSDDDLRRVIDAVKKQLGSNVDQRALTEAITKAADNGGSDLISPGAAARRPLDVASPKAAPKARSSSEVHPEFERADETDQRIIVAAFGRNRPGVAAALTGVMADAGCDIADITQKILQEFFSMIMIVDLTNAEVDFSELKKRLQDIESRLGITIVAQHQDVFRAMHRI